MDSELESDISYLALKWLNPTEPKPDPKLKPGVSKTSFVVRTLKVKEVAVPTVHTVCISGILQNSTLQQSLIETWFMGAIAVMLWCRQILV